MLSINVCSCFCKNYELNRTQNIGEKTQNKRGKTNTVGYKFINSSISHYVIQEKRLNSRIHADKSKSTRNSYYYRHHHRFNVELKMITYLQNSTMFTLFFLYFYFSCTQAEGIVGRYNIDGERFSS